MGIVAADKVRDHHWSLSPQLIFFGNFFFESEEPALSEIYKWEIWTALAHHILQCFRTVLTLE